MAPILADITLVYVAGCQHVAQARAGQHEALRRAGQPSVETIQAALTVAHPSPSRGGDRP